MAENKKLDFIYCDECEASGATAQGGLCRNCQGSGTGVFYRGNYFYWRKKIDRPYVIGQRVGRKLNLIFDIIILLFGLAGLSGLMWWIWNNPVEGFFTFEIGEYPFPGLNFWRSRNYLILFFWFSLLADIFLIYRISNRSARDKGKIAEFPLKPALPPDNWFDVRRLLVNKHGINVSEYFGIAANELLEKSYMLAQSSSHQTVEPAHIFYCLLEYKSALTFFSRLNVDINLVSEKIKNHLDKFEPVIGGPAFSLAAKEAIIEAYLAAIQGRLRIVDVLCFFLPCLERDRFLAEILNEFEIDHDTAVNVIAWFRINDRLVENYRSYRKMAGYKPESAMDRAYTAVATPVLNHYSHDLTLAAKWGRLELCVGRDKELQEIFNGWSAGKPAVLLVGPGGSGKRNIVGGLAQLMAAETVPDFLRDKRLVELDIPRLLGSGGVTEGEEKLVVVLDEIVKAGNIVLFIENAENLTGISLGGEQGMEPIEILAGVLESQGIYCVLTTTTENYTKHLEGHPINSVITKVEVLEPEKNAAIQMIESQIGYFESRFQIYFTYHALSQAVELSHRYLHESSLPEKAFNILEKAAVSVKAERGEGSVVGKEDIAKIIEEVTHIPAGKITENEGQLLLNLEEKIHEKMIGQEEAVHMAAASLRRARTEMRQSGRPIASFLFLGPTGVGKTELAKTIASEYFGGDYLVRLDMSEYQNKESLEKMIGSPEGILGHLTEEVRKMPFCLVLLDEFEKAHPDILNLFLQVFDDGRLTDGLGRTIDFTNCIIVATSNIGANFIQSQISAGAGIDKIKDSLVNDHLLTVMRPELVNRFDGIIVFRPLTVEEIVEIARLQLKGVAKHLEEKGIEFAADDQGLAVLGQAGYDPKFGARPLRRLIQEKIEDEIANKLLSGELKRRDTLLIDSEGKVVVKKGEQI